jgi:flagellar motor switch protein FliG
MRAKDDYRALTGAQKAALLLMSVGEESATKIFALMHDDEIKEISQTMANLGTVSSTVIERLFVEFADQISSTGALTGTFETTERLLAKVLDKSKVDQIMEEIRGPAGRTMWDKLSNVNESVLANYLKNEYPQTVAVVLSKVRSDHASRVLATLPEAFAMEVVMRMLRMEAIQKDVLEDVERTLRNEFLSNLARSSRRDAHEMIAEIFNSWIRAVRRPCSAMSTKRSSRWPSRALRNRCVISSSTTCRSAPRRCCARTWPPWGRSGCATSRKRRWPW